MLCANNIHLKWKLFNIGFSIKNLTRKDRLKRFLMTYVPEKERSILYSIPHWNALTGHWTKYCSLFLNTSEDNKIISDGTRTSIGLDKIKLYTTRSFWLRPIWYYVCGAARGLACTSWSDAWRDITGRQNAGTFE